MEKLLKIYLNLFIKELYLINYKKILNLTKNKKVISIIFRENVNPMKAKFQIKIKVNLTKNKLII